jgi:hypothetical protein
MLLLEIQMLTIIPLPRSDIAHQTPINMNPQRLIATIVTLVLAHEEIGVAHNQTILLLSQFAVTPTTMHPKTLRVQDMTAMMMKKTTEDSNAAAQETARGVASLVVSPVASLAVVAAVAVALVTRASKSRMVSRSTRASSVPVHLVQSLAVL